MQQAAVFEFTSCKLEPGRKRAVFLYKTTFTGAKPIIWKEVIEWPKPIPKTVDRELQKQLLMNLHLALGVSYFKFHYATKVSIPYKLSKAQAAFWNTVYKNGLGEFLYRNKLDPKKSPVFPFVKNIQPKTVVLQKRGKVLVGMGGGKDSILAAELLKEAKQPFDSFLVETNGPSQITRNVAKKNGGKLFIISRTLDPKAFEKHPYNGHVPISTVYAWLGAATCAWFGYDAMVVANEYSSNFGNIRYQGLEINHQWSKSFEFETLFSNYLSCVVGPQIGYFSLLRSFYEIRIAQLFSNYRKYFSTFSSCNRNFAKIKNHSGRWCLQCPKCVSAFALLSAFVSKKDLLAIFGKNLFEDESLLPLFEDLAGLGTMKPFDCVATFQEMQTALAMATKRYPKTPVIKKVAGRVAYDPLVFLNQNESNAPDYLRFCGLENALILGYGKEGKVTHQYLKARWPKLNTGIADASRGKGYLKKQHGYDIAIKTPGINKGLATIPHTTATNLFLSEALGKYPVVGVTGSKGKSTTASLIYAMLRAAGQPVQLLGNIGEPMLGALLKPIKKNTVFVLELSSAQLDDIRYSPDIGVLTSLFPEHMDYHGSVEQYYQAKKNIVRFQNANGVLVYDPTDKKASAWLKGYGGHAVPFAKTVPVPAERIPLLGKHNLRNVSAAVAAARALNIPEAAIKKAILSFKNLPHRLERAGEHRGIIFYDDGSSTNPESAALAIETLKKVDTILLGGQNRGYDFTPLEKALKKYRIKTVVLFPDLTPKNVRLPAGSEVLQTKSMREAVAFAARHTKPGRICLLSGAAPSYSLWTGFNQKGDAFKAAIGELAKRHETKD